MEQIDKEFVVALREDEGLLRRVLIPIARPGKLISDLEAMRQSPAFTVWDMQTIFTNHYQKGKNGYINYIHPKKYDAAFVEGVSYPQFTEYSVLCDSWIMEGNRALTNYCNKCQIERIQPDPQTATMEQANAVGQLQSKQKYDFFEEAMRWIDASSYYKTLNQICCDKSIKMFSKENIGWSTFTYRINDDINVSLRTNFGFGVSSYLIIAVQYKGINILPYSYIVKYYYAGMSDIIRCTRNYETKRESWLAAFSFLANFINESVSNPEKFIQSYIMKEVSDMIGGLEEIARDPESFMDKIRNKEVEKYIVNIRPINDAEKKRIECYPKEAMTLFKVEKITGTLDFTQSLMTLAKEVDSINPYIDRLFQLNKSIYPEIMETITKVNVNLVELEDKKKSLESQLLYIRNCLAPYEIDIEKIRLEFCNKKIPFDLTDYEENHTEYLSLKNQKSEYGNMLMKVNRQIADLSYFLRVLKDSQAKIDQFKIQDKVV